MSSLAGVLRLQAGRTGGDGAHWRCSLDWGFLSNGGDGAGRASLVVKGVVRVTWIPALAGMTMAGKVAGLEAGRLVGNVECGFCVRLDAVRRLRITL